MLHDVVADGEEEVQGEVRVARGPLGHGPVDGTRRVRAPPAARKEGRRDVCRRPNATVEQIPVLI